MTIKTRLFISFSTLVALVVIMSLGLVGFGLQSRKLFNQQLTCYADLLLLRGISQDFEGQWRSLNYYVIVGDKAEREKYFEYVESADKEYDAITNKSPELKQWREEYAVINAATKADIAGNSRERLFNSLDSVLTKKYDKLRAGLASVVSLHEITLAKLDKQVKSVNQFTIVFSAVGGVIAILVGALMSMFIFRSISRPLGVLQKGAQIIGEGNMNFRIPIDSKDEIGRLAMSFNAMVRNLHDLQLQIIQMDRMSSIGQLAGGVAHEINNPLTGVLGQTQLLLEKLPLDDPHRHTIERIESAAQRCRRIVRALLDFARERNYTFQLVDINKLIDENLDLTRAEIDRLGITITKAIPADLPQIRLSSGHIQQVFLNLINNAIQAMSKGGVFHIAAEVSGEFMALSFTDSGTGIKKENVSHVFDPFFTTKDIGKGTGLGLTISYGIIQRHGGEISVYSAGEGKGATFTIKLPLKGSQENDPETAVV